jgi:serine/threonine-protein kinase RsbW
MKMYLELTSCPSSVAAVEPLIAKAVGNTPVSEELYGDILITVTEAVTNAILHGNKANEEKKVRVQVTRQTNQLSFSVSDEGEGFNAAMVPDPTSHENILKCGGRGVFLMQQLSHKISFSDNGSTVKLCFKLK